ncbi:Uncharacterised protein [Budvicia aquatica]|uniref:Uncharacterized protein n=1 Tax=Budvicia aquatica TaxID=82979 RepID=A0A484ZUA7_9GAMM|nr:Uncharacterised protein [Budvicia aquatica]
MQGGEMEKHVKKPVDAGASNSLLQRERSQQESCGERCTSSRILRISATGQRWARPALRFFRPSTPNNVNQLIQRPMDERAAHNVLVT